MNALSDSLLNDSRLYASVEGLARLQMATIGFNFSKTAKTTRLLTGSHNSSHRGSGSNFEELRDYRAGDDIRSVDWKVSNRTRKPHVRLYAEEREQEILILLDQRSSMFFGSQYKTKSVIAAECAGLALWQAMSTKDQNRTVVFNDERIADLGSARNKNSVLRVLSNISKLNQQLNAQCLTQSNTSLSDALGAAKRLGSQGCIILLISDMHDLDPQALDQIKHLSHKNTLLIARVTDPLEHQIPAWATKVFSDGNQQFEASTAGSNVQKHFQQHSNALSQQLKESASRFRYPLIDIDTLSDTVLQLNAPLVNAPLERQAT